MSWTPLNPYTHRWFFIVDQNKRIGVINWIRAHVEDIGFYVPGPHDEDNFTVPCSESGADPAERYAHGAWITAVQFDSLQDLLTDQLPSGLAVGCDQLLEDNSVGTAFDEWLLSLSPPMIVIEEEEAE